MAYINSQQNKSQNLKTTKLEFYIKKNKNIKLIIVRTKQSETQLYD